MKRLSLFLILFFMPLLVRAESKLYHVEIRNAPLSDAARMIAKMDGKNIVVPSKTEGTVTASFEAIDLEEALKAILEANGYGLLVKNDVLQVLLNEELKKTGSDLVVSTLHLKFAKGSEIEEQVRGLISERGSVMTDMRTNSITIRDTPEKVRDVRSLIANIDKEDKQVLIEARIVEASTEFIRSLGVQWGVSKTTGKFQIGGLDAVGTADSTRSLNVNAAAKGLAGGAPASGIAVALGSWAGTLTDIQLSAAEEEGKLNILSRPSVVTMNNQSAKIHSGVKFYVKTSGDVSIGSGGTSASSSSSSNLKEIDAGITMNVTPQVSRDNKINLMIDVTESQPDFSRSVDGIPSIIDNNASTTVLLNNGESTIIGGLFQLQKTDKNRGVPGLMRIPLFGNLFRSKSKGNSRKELIIFIKPTIVDKALTGLAPLEELEDKKE